jgi:hypothetical protein
MRKERAASRGQRTEEEKEQNETGRIRKQRAKNRRREGTE